MLTFYLIQIEPQALHLVKPPLMPLYLLATHTHSEVAFYGISLLSTLPSLYPQLEEPLSIRLQCPEFPIVQGRWSDLLVQSWSHMILEGKVSVHQVVSILKNVAPAIKHLQLTAANKLCQLSVMFSTYDFLLQHPQNYITAVLNHRPLLVSVFHGPVHHALAEPREQRVPAY
jgi:hypothetical protein